MESWTWNALHCSDVLKTTPLSSFLNALSVWVRRPQVLNRRLSTCRILLEGYEQREKVLRILTASGCDCVPLLSTTLTAAAAGSDTVQCVVRSLVPKPGAQGNHSSQNELVIIDEADQSVTFLPLQGDGTVLANGRYRLLYLPTPDGRESRIHLEVSAARLPGGAWLSDGVTSPHTGWLQSCLLPKIASWSRSTGSSSASTVSGYPAHSPLINMERYSIVYDNMKKTYGKAMVKVWPERTDPHKFVYEDIAIASYLLVLWEEEREELETDKKQSFVDLGCGNGLLVHLLSSEGHPGKGVDVRRRRIWDMYGVQTKLEEYAIEPSDKALFPDADWIIGNHSDELTPWIPMIAARSSYTTRYFVLPCCFFDFCSKFARLHHDRSQYRCYLDYIEHIGQQCGFVVKEDVMRIPSTKRVCQVGRARSYRAEEESIQEDRRLELLSSSVKSSQSIVTTSDASDHDESESHSGEAHLSSERESMLAHDALSDVDDQSGESAMWVQSFTARQAAEAVRNGTRIQRDIQQHIVHTVAMALLDKGTTEAGEWNSGGQMSVGDAARLFEKAFLHSLRQECGGLQTVLKNWSQVFFVVGGIVKLRDWSKRESGGAGVAKRRRHTAPGKPSRKQLAKTKLCWFHDNHPQGCPLMTADCSFAHGTTDLQQGPEKPSGLLSLT